MSMTTFLRKRALTIGMYMGLVVPPMILFPGCACAGCACIPAACIPAAKVTGVTLATGVVAGVGEGVGREAGSDAYHGVKDAIQSSDNHSGATGVPDGSHAITTTQPPADVWGDIKSNTPPMQLSSPSGTAGVGMVLQASNSEVTINVGMISGISKGDIVVIYRRNTISHRVEYVADIKLVQVNQNQSVGVVTSSVSDVQEGDLVRKM